MADTKLRITPRARSLWQQLQKSKDPREITALRCALHDAVGLFPWSEISVSQVVREFDYEYGQRKR